MKKKVLWIIGVCIILISIWGIREIYLYNNPEVIITYSNENTEESHRSLPVYATNPKSRFGQAARYDKEMKDWNGMKTAVREGLRKFIYNKTKRSPVILPIFLEV